MTTSVPRFDNIPFSDLSPESERTRLGKGSFGCVYKGEYLGLEVAIKEVMPSGEYDVDKYFQRECKIMAEARHPNIVQYLGLCLAPAAPPSNISPDRPAPTRQRILIISEYLPRGNLRQYIDDSSLAFPWRLRLSFAVDITRALAYLHARQCMHRDLKGENLLCTENERIKMCDFGFARLAAKNDEEMRRISYCGTDGYMSPEILLGEEFSLPTDIFSLGVILCEILSRRLADNHTFARQMPSFGVDFDEVRSLASPHCPPSFLDLALSCLALNPAVRPPVLEILTALRAIEAQVLEAEARGVGLSPEERGTWNVGSVSFAGTTKRGAGRTRPSAPRLPSFEGQVKVVGSSMLAGGRGQKAPRTHGRTDSASSGSEDEVAMLNLAEVEVDVDGGRRKGGESVDGLLGEEQGEGDRGSRYSTAVLGRNRRAHQNIEDNSFASSTLTVRAFAGNQDSTLGHQRLASSASSIPSLPPSWIASSQQQQDGASSASASDESLPQTPQQADGAFPSSKSNDDDGDHVAASYLTARTTTLSITGATVAHGSDDEDTSDEEADERQDHFHSTLLPPPGQELEVHEIPQPTLHRFSLIKPTFQRFLMGSLAPYGAGSSVVQQGGEGEKSSRRKSGSVTPGAVAPSKCGVCSKKLGFTKPFLHCDDCGFHTHIKCSDSCPPGCSAVEEELALLVGGGSPSLPKPTRPLPSPPATRESSNSVSMASNRPSKLVKKKPIAAASARG